jgi:hypothetical protein
MIYIYELEETAVPLVAVSTVPEASQEGCHRLGALLWQGFQAELPPNPISQTLTHFEVQ